MNFQKLHCLLEAKNPYKKGAFYIAIITLMATILCANGYGIELIKRLFNNSTLPFLLSFLSFLSDLDDLSFFALTTFSMSLALIIACMVVTRVRTSKVRKNKLLKRALHKCIDEDLRQRGFYPTQKKNLAPLSSIIQDFFTQRSEGGNSMVLTRTYHHLKYDITFFTLLYKQVDTKPPMNYLEIGTKKIVRSTHSIARIKLNTKPEFYLFFRTKDSFFNDSNVTRLNTSSKKIGLTDIPSGSISLPSPYDEYFVNQTSNPYFAHNILTQSTLEALSPHSTSNSINNRHCFVIESGFLYFALPAFLPIHDLVPAGFEEFDVAHQTQSSLDPSDIARIEKQIQDSVNYALFLSTKLRNVSFSSV